MIDVDRYNKLKELYGHTSSWSIWREPGSTPKSNTGDMSIFDDENICDKLNDKYVFVGFNKSSTHGKQEEVAWKCFHSDYSGQQDFKLRYALLNTPYWGSYMTDIIKEYYDKNSKSVQKYLKKHPRIVKENIKIFEEELSILSDKKPVLIAMGKSPYDILKKKLGHKYKILKILHYSNYISKENYRKKVLEVLNE